MKVGIMGTRGIPNQYGGFEQFAQFISAGLHDRGHDVYVYNSSNHPYKGKEWNGVRIIHCKDKEDKMGTFGQFFYDLNCIKDARKRNFDVLFHFGYSSDSYWWRRWPKNTVNIMNMDGLEWKRTKYNWLTRKFLKKAEAWAATKAQVLVADSPAMQEHILQEYGRQAVFIPYSATPFTTGDPGALEPYNVLPGQYFLLIARMEPENNIEMVIRGYIDSAHPYPLLVIGNNTNKYGKYITKNYTHPGLKFIGSLFDQAALNNLRHFSSLYFHGHSVGGTNPSLLEAMACGCTVAAHDNVFNRAILDDEGAYFSDMAELSALINRPKDIPVVDKNKFINLEKIKTIYHPEKILNAYEALAVSSRQ